jgi:hypothetical protein
MPRRDVECGDGAGVDERGVGEGGRGWLRNVISEGAFLLFVR